MLNHKKFTFCMLLFFLISAIFTTPNADASGTSVNIKIKASTYANLYYEILFNGQKIDKDIRFELFNEKEELVGVYYTDNGILLIRKIPFGSYLLKPKGYENSFRIIVDKDYLQTQHILKPLELKEKMTSSKDNDNLLNPKTGDDSKGIIYLIIFLVSGLCLIIIVLNKARSEQNEDK